MRKTVTYMGGLIAFYLAVHYSSGTKGVMTAGANGLTSTIKALQGRG